jgi:hypothetical protein
MAEKNQGISRWVLTEAIVASGMSETHLTDPSL